MNRLSFSYIIYLSENNFFSKQDWTPCSIPSCSPYWILHDVTSKEVKNLKKYICCNWNGIPRLKGSKKTKEVPRAVMYYVLNLKIS